MVYIGADHGGVELKEKVKAWLHEWGEVYIDLGASSLIPDDDYPDYALSVAKKVSLHPESDRGILICRSGGGMVIAANRVPQVRAVYIFDEKSAEHARKDNNANIASFAADWTEPSVVKQAVSIFLHTPFSQEERHVRRLAKLEIV